MSYKTLMVHVDLGATNERLFDVANNLAGQFDANVMGVAACQTSPVACHANAYLMTDFFGRDRAYIENQIEAAEERFKIAFCSRAHNLEWRSAYVFDRVVDFLAHQARAADLILIDTNGGGAAFDPTRGVDVGDLVMRVGRPVLMVPPGEPKGNLAKAVVCWKDTREAQLAVADALPILRKASAVTVVEIAADEELQQARSRVQDVASWLARHNIRAETCALAGGGNDAAHLDAFANDRDAGLLIAGAYGHNRLREWVFGGVTRDLLLRSERCSFVSH